MVSEFRRIKLFHIFYTFFDTDSSGSVSKDDFELAADNIAKMQKWGADDPKYSKTKEALLNVWDKLQSAADSDGDGEVTAEEWLKMWEEYGKNPSSPFEWQSLYCKFVFDLQDASGDGVIDEEEVSKVYEAFGIPKEDAIACFKKMAKGKTAVSWEDFQELWKGYFTSEDPQEPGNFIFGVVSY